MKVIELGKNVLAANDVEAEALRERMRAEGRLLINLMSAPGSGKTTLISRLIGDMRDIAFGVMEADIESCVDAERIEALGARAIQAHTGGMCHMDAYMTSAALSEMGADGLDIVFLENVGNLICPAEYDTGAGLKIMILSVPEGDDKPLKYPLMFRESDALVITKKDALDYFNFDLGRCAERAKKLNPAIKIFPVSAKTGEGMGELENYLREKL
ncbi:MAG: hydrogenase nickel incorporation protein HypB, partial [Oscillospiraceae bacterium]|nr:hydrogenase nickel incorporation protein HypB [Oscillospiraceae bacterium]